MYAFKWPWQPWLSYITSLRQFLSIQFSSVAQSCPTLQHRGLEHARLPCPSPPPRAHSNLCPSSWWCHPIISSSVVPFSSCLQSFPESGSFLMSWLSASGGRVLELQNSPSNKYSGLIFLGWTGLISLQSKGLSRVFSNTMVQKHQFFDAEPFLWSNSRIHMNTGKIIALTIWTFVGRVMSLLFNTRSRFVIAFLPRNKHLLNFMVAVTICSD